jgi:hypothetical protein
MVRDRPSSRDTFSSQPSTCFARVTSGRLRRGSSYGRGWKKTVDEDRVILIPFFASARTVISLTFPMLMTCPRAASIEARRRSPSIWSVHVSKTPGLQTIAEDPNRVSVQCLAAPGNHPAVNAVHADPRAVRIEYPGDPGIEVVLFPVRQKPIENYSIPDFLLTSRYRSFARIRSTGVPTSIWIPSIFLKNTRLPPRIWTRMESVS